MSNEQLSELTMQSSPEVALAIILDMHFKPEQIIAFWNKRPPKDIRIKDPYKSLKQFLDSPLFKERFNKQWKYETGPQWGDRTVEEAVFESMAHAFVSIANEAQFYLLYRDQRDRLPNLSNLSRGKVGKINWQARFLANYVGQNIPSGHS
ncbi:MAG: hypothetical protein ACOZBZ_00395 [Patescibacteria group bacterium]